jgi:D-alanine transaminase
MSRVAYVDGRYIPHGEAAVHVEDRGFQFADSVYEVCEVRDNCLIDLPRHLARLAFSLGELRIDMPISREALISVLRETVWRNRFANGMVYLQVSRGATRRDHAFPGATPKPTLVVTARGLDRTAGDMKAAAGVKVVTVPDLRWGRVDIKTTSLIANVLARQAAREQGAFEAWLVDEEGKIVEGAATNAWIVTPAGVVVTRPSDGSILSGVTRATLLDVMRAKGIPFEERRFDIEEATGAAEAFCTGATLIVMPVISLDNQPIGNGRPGTITTLLRANFHEFADKTPL